MNALREVFESWCPHTVKRSEQDPERYDTALTNDMWQAFQAGADLKAEWADRVEVWKNGMEADLNRRSGWSLLFWLGHWWADRPWRTDCPHREL